MILSLLAALSIASTKPEFDLNTLDFVCKDLTKTIEYKINIDESLRYRPVVYHIEHRDNPLKQLKSLCDALLLTCEVDSKRKSIEIYRSALAKTYDRQTCISRTLNDLFNSLAITANWSPKQIYDEAQKQLDLAGQTGLDAATSQRHRDLSELYYTSFRSGERTIFASLKANRLTAPKTLAATCTIRNRIGLSPESNSLLQAYFDGRGIDFIDALTPESMSPERWKGQVESDRAVRKFITDAAQKQPIPVIRHTLYSSELFIGVYAILPDNLLEIGSLSVRIQNPQFSVPIQNQDLPMLQSSVEYGSPLTYRIDSPCVKGYNQARWFCVPNYPNYATYQDLVNRTQTRITTHDDWINIIDYQDPFPEYGYDWRPFLKLRSFSEQPLLTSTEWLQKLQSLSDEEIADLESLHISIFPTTLNSYSGITGGVRLLRAVLRQLDATKTNQVELEVDRLVDPARNDILAFCKGTFTWRVAPPLLHPKNQSKIGSFILNARIKGAGTQAKLEFSLKHSLADLKIASFFENTFSVPIVLSKAP